MPKYLRHFLLYKNVEKIIFDLLLELQWNRKKMWSTDNLEVNKDLPVMEDKYITAVRGDSRKL